MTATLTLKKLPDTVLVPSGKEIDLSDVDVSALESSDDCWEVLQALEEKIIDIEYQVAAHEIGRFPSGKPYSAEMRADPMWLPRAKKSLSWTRLRKADVQRRLGILARQERADDRNTMERAFIDAAHLLLEQRMFQKIMDIARDKAGMA